MKAYECAGQREKIYSDYQLLHCIFHLSHHFQQELQKKSRELGISRQLITPHVSKKLAILQQEIKASNFWDLLPDGIPDANIPPHPNTQRIYPDYQQPWCVLCAGTRCDNVGHLSQKFKPHQCILSDVRCNSQLRASWQEVNFSLLSVHAGFMRTIPLLPEL